MKLGKVLLGVSLGLVLLMIGLVFPWFKVFLVFWITGVLIYNSYKYKNWTFLVPPIGGGMNLTAIIANGGIMPVSPAAITLDPGHAYMTSGTHLKFLCDIFPIGHIGLFSAGDVVIAIIWPLTILGFYAYNKHRKVTNATGNNIL